MKIFSLKRLLGMAAIYGVVRYVRTHGGVGPAFEALKAQANDLMTSAKQAARESVGDTSFATNVGHGPTSSVAKGGRSTAYASYDLDTDGKLRH